MGSGDVLAKQPGGERGGRATQLRPFQRDRAGGRFHRHRPIPVAGTRLSLGCGGSALVAATAEEFGHLGLERGLHQQLSTQAGHLLQDLG